MAIIDNNVQNVSFLRNQNPFETREAAVAGLEANKGASKDGSILLARYTTTESGATVIKTVAGLIAVSGSTKYVTVIDVEGASGDVDALRREINAKLGEGVTSANTATAQLTALSGSTFVPGTSSSANTSVEGAKAYAYDLIGTLDYTDTAVTGSYVSEVNESNGVISVTRVALSTVAAISGAGQAITAVSESLGEISAVAGDIAAAHVTIADAGGIITAENVEGALAEIAAEIDAMDKEASAVDGQVVTTVSEVDGVVSETKANVKDLQLGGYVKGNDTGDIASADTINVALSKLENKAAAITIANDDGSINVTTGVSGTDINVNIKSSEKVLAKDGNNGIYTDIKLSGITPSSTTVKEEYALIATDGSQLGTSIKVYKDSSVVNITYQSDPEEAHYQNLIYTYVDISGNTQTEYVDISALVLEAEFASGVTVTDHVAHGVVDPTSENFLTVGANGFKLSGVQDAIGTAISGLDVSDSAVAGKYVSQVSETDGKISVSRANVSEAILNNYSKGSTSGAVTSADTVNEAISKLEVRIDGEIAALDATVSGETTDGKVNVKVTEADGKITAVDVVGTDIASSSALTAEITARKAVDGQNGQTYVANANKTYISGATSLNDADIKLNDALKSLSDETVNQVKVNNIALAETSNAVNIQISAVNGTGASATPIVINTDSNTGAVTIQLEGIDCGTY